MGFLHIKVGYQNFAFVLSLAVIFYGVHKMNIKTSLIIKSIAYIAILQALWGVFQRCSGIYFPFTYTLGHNTPVAGLDNASNFGAFLAISLPCCFYLHWISGLFVLIAIVVANKFVSLVAGLVGLFFIYPSKKLLIIFPILILIFFFIFKHQCLDWKSSSIMTRVKIWSESLKLAKYKPYIGFGQGNYKIVMPQYMNQKELSGFGQSTTSSITELWDNPSNDYIKTIFEAGFVSLAFILFIILITLKKYLYILKTKELQTLFGSFMAILLISSGYSVFLNPTNVIWTVIIFGLLNSELRRQHDETANNRNLYPSLNW